MDLLTSILTIFNDLFGKIDTSNADNVKRQIANISAMVSNDEKYQNAMKNSDKENARMESERVLQNVIFSIMADNMELSKQYNDNPSFKKWLSDMVFNTSYNVQGKPFVVEKLNNNNEEVIETGSIFHVRNVSEATAKSSLAAFLVIPDEQAIMLMKCIEVMVSSKTVSPLTEAEKALAVFLRELSDNGKEELSKVRIIQSIEKYAKNNILIENVTDINGLLDSLADKQIIEIEWR